MLSSQSRFNVMLLTILLQDDDYSPASIVIHGLEATGKTLVLRSFLESSGSSFSWVPCHECVTTRHLIERIAATVCESLGAVESAARCENVSALAVQLQQTLKESQRKHFLVRQTPITSPSLDQGLMRRDRFWTELIDNVKHRLHCSLL